MLIVNFESLLGKLRVQQDNYESCYIANNGNLPDFLLAFAFTIYYIYPYMHTAYIEFLCYQCTLFFS